MKKQIETLIEVFRDHGDRASTSSDQSVIQCEISSLIDIHQKYSESIPLGYALSDFHQYLCDTWIDNDETFDSLLMEWKRFRSEYEAEIGELSLSEKLMLFGLDSDYNNCGDDEDKLCRILDAILIQDEEKWAIVRFHREQNDEAKVCAYMSDPEKLLSYFKEALEKSTAKLQRYRGSEFDQLAFPCLGFKTAERLLKNHDPRILGLVIAYLEVDPWYNHSGYLKRTMCRYIRGMELGAEQKVRLANVVVRQVQESNNVEIAEYAKIAGYLQVPDMTEEIAELMNHPNGEIKKRATRVMNSINAN